MVKAKKADQRAALKIDHATTSWCGQAHQLVMPSSVRL
jgi:hypothetical protein